MFNFSWIGDGFFSFAFSCPWSSSLTSQLVNSLLGDGAKGCQCYSEKQVVCRKPGIDWCQGTGNVIEGNDGDYRVRAVFSIDIIQRAI